MDAVCEKPEPDCVYVYVPKPAQVEEQPPKLEWAGHMAAPLKPEVANPKYYVSNWLDFMGNLYKEIMTGRFRSDGKAFMAPLSETKIQEYAEQGVPEIFMTTIR